MKKENIIKLMKKFLSDSKKESEEAKEELEKLIKSKIDRLQKIAIKFGMRYATYYDSKYGSIEIIEVDLNEEEVYVEYYDSWGYGGYCSEDLIIGLEIFEDWYEEDYFNKCKNRRIKELNDEINTDEKNLEKKKQLLEKFKKEKFYE